MTTKNRCLGGYKAVGERRKKENVEGGGGIRGTMGRKAVTNYCHLREGKGIGGWWNEKIGVEDVVRTT